MRLFAISIAFSAAFASCTAIAADGPRPSNAEILFRLANPCPTTGQIHGPCRGYVVDRVIPAVCGGADAPDNMKWLTLAEAKEKKKWERIGCRAGRKLVLPGQATVEIEAFALKGSPEPVEAKPLSIGGSTRPIAPEPMPAESDEEDEPGGKNRSP